MVEWFPDFDSLTSWFIDQLRPQIPLLQVKLETTDASAAVLMAARQARHVRH
jgi:hypothetical protein